MEREVSNVVKIGVVLLCVSFIIVVSFGVFSVMRKTANQGVEENQEMVIKTQNLEFEDFNNKDIKGRNIIEFLKFAESKDMVVLVRTAKMNSYDYVSKDKSHYIQIYQGKSYVNYSSILCSDIDGNTVLRIEPKVSISETDDTLYLVNNNITTKNPLYLDNNGKIVKNNDIHNSKNFENIEYIDENSDFAANLLYDSTGSIIGIICEQISI